MGKHTKQKPTFTIDEVDALTLKACVNSERLAVSEIKQFLHKRWEIVSLMAYDSMSPEVRKVFVPYAEGFKGAINAIDDFLDNKENEEWIEDDN